MLSARGKRILLLGEENWVSLVLQIMKWGKTMVVGEDAQQESVWRGLYLEMMKVGRVRL